MRISCLHLMAYGPFTDQRIVFGDHEGGLDIVFGLNEAGKSSALRALSGWLYGIPARTADNFLHGNRDLRIGGKLVYSDGSTLEFLRRKGNRNTLIGPGGEEISDGSLARFLGSVREMQFTQLFGLDHRTLVEGGKVILEGKGELGESLLAAGTGGASIRRIMQALEEEARTLYEPRARTRLINTKLGEYETARRSALENSLSGRAWEERRKALDDALLRRKQLADLIEEKRKEISRLERLQQALPLVARRADLLASMEGMGERLVLPDDFGKLRREAEGMLLGARERRENALEAMAFLEKEIDGIEVPEKLIVQERNINAIYERLGSHNKAMKDLPERQGERDSLLAEAQAILKGIKPGLATEEAKDLRSALSRRKSMQRQAVRYQELASAIETNTKGIAEEDERLEKLYVELDGLETPRDASGLKAALRALHRRGNLGEVSDELGEEIAGEEAQARVELSKLTLWEGSLDELEMLGVPGHETVDRFDALLRELHSSLEEKDKEAGQLEKELVKVRRNRKRLKEGKEIPDEESLSEARLRRDLGWSLVKRAWLGGEDVSSEEADYDPDRPLPDAYEAMVAGADNIADRLRREADRVAELIQMELREEELESDLSEVKREREHLQQRLEQAEKEWESAWKEAGLRPLTPAEMRTWLNRHENLTQRAQRIRELRLRRDKVQGLIAQHEKDIAGLLSGLGEDATPQEGLEILEGRAEALCAHIEAVETERRQLEKSLADLERRKTAYMKALDKTNADLKKWRKAWAESMEELGISPEAEPEEALSFLENLGAYFDLMDDAEKQEKRISDILSDAEGFRKYVAAFVAEYAPDMVDQPAEQAAAELHARLLKATADAAKKLEKQREHERQRKRAAQAEADIKNAEGKLRKLCRQARCTMEALEEAERRSQEYARLESDLALVEEQLLPFRKGEPLERLLAEVAEIDADVLPARIETIDKELRGIADMCTELDREIGEQRGELAKMDGSEKAAGEAEKAESALAGLRSLVERYAILRAGYILLREEVDRYCSRNQDPLLVLAGETFSLLTDGYFQGVQLDYDDNDRPVIVGVRPSGERVGVEGMSDGTCDQLYLALRLASIEAFLANNEPFPFIADDILIRFDDHRARAALKALMRLAEKTQVILFTHHSHIVELAKEIADGDNLRIHELRAKHLVPAQA